MATLDPSSSLWQIAHSLAQDDIPFKLRCAICNQLVINAYRLPCCDQAICAGCQSSLPESCPVCAHTPLAADLCKPNKALRTTLKAFLRTEEKKRDRENEREREKEKIVVEAVSRTDNAIPTSVEDFGSSEAGDGLKGGNDTQVAEGHRGDVTGQFDDAAGRFGQERDDNNTVKGKQEEIVHTEKAQTAESHSQNATHNERPDETQSGTAIPPPSVHRVTPGMPPFPGFLPNPMMGIMNGMDPSMMGFNPIGMPPMPSNMAMPMANMPMPPRMSMPAPGMGMPVAPPAIMGPMGMNMGMGMGMGVDSATMGMGMMGPGMGMSNMNIGPNGFNTYGGYQYSGHSGGGGWDQSVHGAAAALSPQQTGGGGVGRRGEARNMWGGSGNGNGYGKNAASASTDDLKFNANANPITDTHGVHAGGNVSQHQQHGNQNEEITLHGEQHFFSLHHTQGDDTAGTSSNEMGLGLQQQQRQQQKLVEEDHEKAIDESGSNGGIADPRPEEGKGTEDSHPAVEQQQAAGDDSQARADTSATEGRDSSIGDADKQLQQPSSKAQQQSQAPHEHQLPPIPPPSTYMNTLSLGYSTHNSYPTDSNGSTSYYDGLNMGVNISGPMGMGLSNMNMSMAMSGGAGGPNQSSNNGFIPMDNRMNSMMKDSEMNMNMPIPMSMNVNAMNPANNSMNVMGSSGFFAHPPPRPSNSTSALQMQSNGARGQGVAGAPAAPRAMRAGLPNTSLRNFRGYGRGRSESVREIGESGANQHGEGIQRSGVDTAQSATSHTNPDKIQSTSRPASRSPSKSKSASISPTRRHESSRSRHSRYRRERDWDKNSERDRGVARTRSRDRDHNDDEYRRERRKAREEKDRERDKRHRDRDRNRDRDRDRDREGADDDSGRHRSRRDKEKAENEKEKDKESRSYRPSHRSPRRDAEKEQQQQEQQQHLDGDADVEIETTVLTDGKENAEAITVSSGVTTQDDATSTIRSGDHKVLKSSGRRGKERGERERDRRRRDRGDKERERDRDRKRRRGDRSESRDAASQVHHRSSHRRRLTDVVVDTEGPARVATTAPVPAIVTEQGTQRTIEKDEHTLEREARNRERMLKEKQRREAMMENGGGEGGGRVSRRREKERERERERKKGREQDWDRERRHR